MNRKALLLFIATSVIWGSSFLFIRLAVEHMPPSAVVFGRTVLGAAFLVPLAIRKRAFPGAGAVLLSALGYAAAALLYRRWLADVPALAVTALMTAISSLLFLAPAAAGLPGRPPPAGSIAALAALGIVNTGLAYWLFYLLIDQAGAATASVITYIMPVVALVLGVGLLGEKLTVGAIAGLPLIAVGAWLATSSRTPGQGRRGPRQPPRQATSDPARRSR